MVTSYFIELVWNNNFSVNVITIEMFKKPHIIRITLEYLFVLLRAFSQQINANLFIFINMHLKDVNTQICILFIKSSS